MVRCSFVCESSVAHRRGGELGYELVLIEPLQLERLDQVRGLAGGGQLGQRLADDRRRLESVRPPPRADVEPLDLGLAEYRRVVGRQVAQSRQAPQHPRALQLWEQLDRV